MQMFHKLGKEFHRIIVLQTKLCTGKISKIHSMFTTIDINSTIFDHTRLNCQ